MSYSTDAGERSNVVERTIMCNSVGYEDGIAATGSSRDA